jgi:hypothetical protein
MGLHADILLPKDGRDSSLNGFSAKFKQVTIINADGPFKPSATAPPVELIRGPGGSGHVIAVPVNSEFADVPHTDKMWRMASAGFVHTSDSRFHDLVARLGGTRGTAISMHDRFEDWPK